MSDLWERQRMLATLFMAMCLALPFALWLTERFPLPALVIAALSGLVLLSNLTLRIRARRLNRNAVVGPLTHNERVRARARLVRRG
jgi:hypothetical protein